MGDVVDRQVRCGACGKELSEFTDLSPEDRTPCPDCGSLARTFALSISAEARVSSLLSGLQLRDDEAIAFFESERKGRKSAANLTGGVVEFSIHGSSPQGEEDTVSTCHILLEKLKEDGQDYHLVLPGLEPADCTLVHNAEDNTGINIQVVRAITSQSLWKRLARERAVDTKVDMGDITRALHEAISFKADRFASMARTQLVLALDDTRLPGLGFDAVVRHFRSVEGSWAASLGFAAVWLVGPTTRLTWRLDVK